MKLLTSVLAVSVLLSSALLAQAEPYVPASDGEVLERVPTRPSGFDSLRARVAESPQDPEVAVQLAERYVALARAEADPRYFGRAQAVLAPWWNVTEPPAAVLTLRAQLRQSRHDFEGALADLDGLVARAPQDAEAWFMRAVVLEIRGEHAAALESCAPLWRLADALAATACTASAASLSGRAQASYALLSEVLVRARDADPQMRQWALTVLAEIAARTGSAGRAEQHYRVALATAHPDHYLLASFADFLLEQSRYDEVRALLADFLQADALLLRLAIAAQRAEASEAPALIEMLGARFEASRARGEQLHLAAEARYLLALQGEPARALALARANFAVQREPGDLRLVLEAALAADDPAAAREALEWLARTGLEDARSTELAVQLKEGAL